MVGRVVVVVVVVVVVDAAAAAAACLLNAKLDEYVETPVNFSQVPRVCRLRCMDKIVVHFECPSSPKQDLIMHKYSYVLLIL